MELFEERTIEELKLFTEPWLKDDREYFECVCSQQELERIKNAAEAYTRTDPDHSRYGIGKSSVSKHFVALNKEAVSYYQHFR